MKKTAYAGTIAMALGWMAMTGAQGASNSLVRFHVTHGSTVVGDMVVELFDEEKPVTVQNFLSYVRNGSYDNLILYRCVPNFVIQAGITRTPAPLNAGGFSGSLVNTDHGAITNEFEVGPRLTNGFGTLAMAKIDGNPNSAKLDWFINLTNNSPKLDTNNGGFTVFGKVLSGTNVLNFFNHPGPSLGFYPFSSPFEDLPVAYNRHPQPYPRFLDLFTIQITSLDTPPDPKRPTINIDFPPAGTRWSNETITVTGRAADNAGIRTVWQIREGGIDFTNALGTTNWSLPFALKPGTNNIFVQSVDTSGRRSAFASRVLFWSVPQAIEVHHFGEGTITGPTDGQVLELERFYYLNAIPARGHAFHSWTGSVAGEAFTWLFPQLGFKMKTNMTATALFVTNPFVNLKGAYVGAFFNVSNFQNFPQLKETLGSISFNLTDQGRVSGRVKQGPGSYPFSGSFSTRGFATLSAVRPGLAPLEIRLTLGVTNQSIEVPFLVSDNRTFGSYGKLIRAASGTLAQPSPYTGRYTVALPGGTNRLTAPPGHGPGTAKVANNGALNFAGTLADGTPVTQGTPITTNGFWPFYLPLYSGKGAVFAWSQFNTNQPDADLHGDYIWVKRTNVASPYYPAGFVITNILTGSLYRVPAGNTNRILPLTDAQFVFTDGNLAGSVTNAVAWLPNNTISNRGPTALTATFTKANGLFSGSFKPPGASKALTFKGAVDQKQTTGFGYFRGTNLTGRVLLGP